MERILVSFSSLATIMLFVATMNHFRMKKRNQEEEQLIGEIFIEGK